MSSINRSDSDDFKKSRTLLQEVIKAYDFPLGTPPKIDLATDLYSGSNLVSHYDNMDLFDSSDLFTSLNT
jgi:hypothetical protein